MKNVINEQILIKTSTGNKIVCAKSEIPGKINFQYHSFPVPYNGEGIRFAKSFLERFRNLQTNHDNRSSMLKTPKCK